MGVGYKPILISTIVDIVNYQKFFKGYKPILISTIVDHKQTTDRHLGYKPILISTIVDSVSLFVIFQGL